MKQKPKAKLQRSQKKTAKPKAGLSFSEKKRLKGLQRTLAGNHKEQEKPTTAQNTITFKKMFRDGICQVTSDFYTKMVEFYDINYDLLEIEDQGEILEEYSKLINYFDPSIRFELFLFNRQVNEQTLIDQFDIPLQGDDFDDIREEYTDMLKKQAAKGNNCIIKSKYLIFGTECKGYKEAKSKLNNIEKDVIKNLLNLGTNAKSLDGKERLRILHEYFNQDTMEPFRFSFKELAESGKSVKDYIAPPGFDFRYPSRFKAGKMYGSIHYETVKAEFSCGGYTFATSGKSVLKNGWKDFEDAFKRSFKTTEEKEQEDKKLPELSEGQTFDGVQTKISEHYTTPPKHFTEDSLLSAMERAGNEDMSDDVERKGLGTPATRADIIEKLVKDGFVKREKKQMIPTEDGMKLITVLPDVVKSPKLTADWENSLTLVAKGEYSMQEFMDGIADMVKNLVQTYHSISDEQKSMFGGNQSAQEALGKCPKCGGDVVKGKYGAYCKSKCGMNVGKAMGTVLSDTQIKSMLEGKKTFVKGLKGKKGTYDAYLIPEGIEDYSYTKDGKEIKGSQYKVKLEFAKRSK